MEVIEFGRLSESQRDELEGDEEDPFEAGDSSLRWREKERHVGLRDHDGRLVAAAGVVTAELETEAGDRVPVAGIGGVIVAAPFRGQGLGARIIAEVVELAGRSEGSIAMLFCHPDRAGLYARHGFVEISAPVFAEQPDGMAEMPPVAMWRPLRAGATLPSGRLSVRGLPF